VPRARPGHPDEEITVTATEPTAVPSTTPVATPSGSRTFTLGADARCRDGGAGTVTRVVVDPRTRAVTHLVVTPRHHRGGFGRLVPVGLVSTGPAGEEVVLDCTLEELATFPEAEEHHFLPGNEAYGGYGPAQALAWPYYYYGTGYVGGIGMGGSWTGDGLGVGMGGGPVLTTSETVPLGEVSVHRGDPVRTTDGNVGHLHGLVLGPDDRVSHLLLQEGHLWGRKQVAIPISSVTSMDDGVAVRLTTRQVHDLPEITLLPHPAAEAASR
jgi:sporulation protein YlmC with PRC-barrel domain